MLIPEEEIRAKRDYFKSQLPYFNDPSKMKARLELLDWILCEGSEPVVAPRPTEKRQENA